jgi:hypothetical protein
VYPKAINRTRSNSVPSDRLRMRYFTQRSVTISTDRCSCTGLKPSAHKSAPPRQQAVAARANPQADHSLQSSVRLRVLDVSRSTPAGCLSTYPDNARLEASASERTPPGSLGLCRSVSCEQDGGQGEAADQEGKPDRRKPGHRNQEEYIGVF